MERYGKTYNVWKRDETTHRLIPNRWTLPEFEYLRDCKWSFTEKIDGTNMRLILHPGGIQPIIRDGFMRDEKVRARFELKGRSDKASVHGSLLDWLRGWKDFVRPQVDELLDEEPMCIYGEGCGAGIQGGAQHYGEMHFRAFAIKVGRWWLKPEAIDDICRKLHLRQAPHILSGTLMDGIEKVESGLRTMIGPNPGVFVAEGLIGVPEVPLLRRDGSRLVVKLKTKDLCHAD